MAYSIRLPDGSLVENIPDEITPEAAKARILQYRPDLAPPPSVPAAPSKQRTWGEAAKDIGAGVVSGIGSLVQAPGQLYGLATGNFDKTGALGLGEDIAAYGEGMKSAGLKAREAARAAAIQEAEKRGEVAAGLAAVKETIKDPALLTSFLAEQVPQLAIPGGAAKAAGSLAMRGAGAGLEGLAKEAAIKTAKESAIKAGERAAIGAGAVQQGADVGAQAYADIYKKLIEQGKSPEEAAAGAINLARVTGASGAVISVLAQHLPGAKSIEHYIAGGKEATSFTRGALKGALGEGASEMAEEGGGKLAQNLAMQQVDPTQRLTQGLGQTMGMAAIGGVGLGGTLGGLSAKGVEQPAPAPVQEAPPAPVQEAPAPEVPAPAPQMPAGYAELEQEKQRLLSGPKSQEVRDRLAQIKQEQTQIVAADVANKARDISAQNKAGESAFAAQEPQQMEMREATVEQPAGVTPPAPVEAAPEVASQDNRPPQKQLNLPLKQAGEAPTRTLDTTIAPLDMFGKPIEQETPQSPQRAELMNQYDTLAREMDRLKAQYHVAPTEEMRTDLLKRGEQYQKSLDELRQKVADLDAGKSIEATQEQPQGKQLGFRLPQAKQETPQRTLEEQQPVTEPKIFKPTPLTPETVPTKMSPEVLGALGIGPTSVMRKPDHGIHQLDIAKPEEAAQVKTLLEAYKEGKSEGIVKKIDAYLARPEFKGVTNGQVPQAAAGKANVRGTKPSVRVSGERSEVPAGQPKSSETGPLGRAVAAVGQLARGEGKPAPAVEGKAPKINLPEALKEKPATNAFGTPIKGKRFSTTQSTPKQAATAKIVEDVVAQVSKLLNGKVKVNIHNSVSDVFPDQRAGSRSGMLHNGEVYVFLDGIGTKLDAQKVVFHELFHKGLRNLMSVEQYNNLLLKLYNQSAEIREKVDAWIESSKGKNLIEEINKENEGPVDPKAHEQLVQAIATEEVLAELAEDTEIAPSLLRKIGNWLASVADTFGMHDLAKNIRGMGINPLRQFLNDTVRAGVKEGTVSSQTRFRVNEKLLDINKRVSKKIGDLTYTLQGSKHGPTIEVTDDNGNEVASMSTEVVDDELEVRRVAVNPEHRGKGVAQTMYAILSGTGNDIRRSDNQLPAGAAMWDAFERSGFAKEGKIAQTRFRTTNNGQEALQSLKDNFNRTAKEQPPSLAARTRAAAFNAVNNPASTAAETKQTFTKWLDKLETVTADSSAGLTNELTRSILRGTKTDQEKMGALLQLSTAQRGGSIASAVLEYGKAVWEEATHKWKVVEDKGSFKAVVQKIEAIASKEGLTYQEAELIAHTLFEARNVGNMRRRNAELQKRIVDLESKGKKAEARKLRENLLNIHLTDAQIAAGLKLRETIPALDDVVDTWNAARKNALDVMVASGLHSEADANALFDNMDYVPFYREEQVAAGDNPKQYISGLQVAAKDRRLKGSSQAVNNILENQQMWINSAISRSVANKQGVALANAAVENGVGKWVDGPIRGEHVAKVWVNGEQKFVMLDDPLYMDAFNGLQSVAIPMFKWAAGMAKLLRNSVVLHPLFAISQVPQDAYAAMFTSGLSPRYALTIPALAVKEFIKTLAGTSKSHEELKKYGAVGVHDFQSVLADADSAIYKSDAASKGLLKRVGEMLHHIATASDSAVRQATFEAAQAQGLSKAEAIEKAFNIANFRNRGTSKGLALAGQVIPFFHAYIAMQHVAFKTLTGKGTSPTKRSEAFKNLIGTTAATMVLSTLYAMLNGDDDDYLNKPTNVRDRLLMIPGTGGISIPLRMDVFSIPKIIAEHTYLLMTDKGTEDGYKFRQSMKNALITSLAGPTPVPQIVKPLVEVGINHDFFQGREIISKTDQAKETSRQFKDSTSELGKLLGSTGLIAPINVDHLMRGMFGSAGGLTMYLSNQVLGSENERPELSMQDAISTFPGMSSFVSKENETGLKSDFYELQKEVLMAANTYKDIQTRSPEQLEAFLAKPGNIEKLSLVSSINSMTTNLGNIRKQMTRVTNDVNIPASQKRTILDELKNHETQMLKAINLKDLRERAKI